MGGLVKKAYSWFVQKPLRTAGIAAALALPYSAYSIMTSNAHSELTGIDFISFVMRAMSPMFVFPCAGISAELLKTFTYEDKYNPRTRIDDFRKRNWLESKIKKRNFDQIVNAEFELQRQSSIQLLLSGARSSVPDTEKGADKVAALAEANKDSVLYADAVLRYFRHEKFDEAFVQINRLFELQQAPPVLFLPQLIVNAVINKWDRFLNPRNPFGLIYASMLSALRKNYSQALYYSTFARKTAEFFGSSAKKEVYCLEALIHHALRSKDSGHAWSRCIAEIKKEPVLERISETKNPVRVVAESPFLSKTLVFKDKEQRASLEAEAEMTDYISEMLPENFSTSEHLYITNSRDEGYYTYVMRRVSGETLLEMFKQEDYSVLASIAGVLGQIHAKVPAEMVRNGRLSVAFKLRHKLTSPDLALPQDLVKKIVHNYRPVFNLLNGANFVYNKDAHPENWLVYGKSVIVLDCENGFLVPQQFDLVNLLEYSDYLSDSQKEEAVGGYIASYEDCTSVVLDKEKFMLTYFNAVIHRAISLCTAWSSKDRSSMHSQRAKIISNAILAVDKIRQKHGRYYSRFKSHYLNIGTALENIKELVSV